MEDIVQSGNLELDKAIRNWLRWDSPTSESYSLVQELVRKKQWSELSKIMLKRLGNKTQFDFPSAQIVYLTATYF